MDNVEWVPIAMFIAIMVVCVSIFWFRYKTKTSVHETIRAALDKGQDLSPEVIDRLGHPKPAKNKDLRLGVIWFAIAIGLVSFGLGIPDEEDVARIFAGIAAFPACLGIAYLILHKFANND